MAQPPGKSQSFQAPTGTRDFYPIELARRRFIEDAWRKVSIRHGFDEIDGPTFEHLDLYTVKSGEGIVSELFSFQRAGGEKTYALRPEFTPTLARLYAANAGSLAKPTKWFWQSTCFRAERPQRGRLREFMQWNADSIGEGAGRSDAELIALCADVLRSLGLRETDVRIRIGHRQSVARQLYVNFSIDEASHPTAIAIVDKAEKLERSQLVRLAIDTLSLSEPIADRFVSEFCQQSENPVPIAQQREIFDRNSDPSWHLTEMLDELEATGAADLCVWDPRIVRGLAYYTGMVFEVHEAGGNERAIAGGGRYDNLIELFGGPPTPAVGFGMGDVVLSLVLQDKKLMPSDKEIARSLGLRPDAFIISNGTPESDAQLTPMLAGLRRRGMHARRSYRTTKNIGKLLKEASDADARFAIIIESPTEITLKNLDDGTQDKGPAEMLLARIK